MNIYFACSITGGRQDAEIYRIMVETLQADGHDLPSAVFAVPSPGGGESHMEPEVVYRRDVAWIEACDVLIAEVSTPSHGVGYEIGYALHLGKPVLCLHREEKTVSKMLTGNPDTLLQMMGYADVENGVATMRACLAKILTESAEN
ncbi:MAG: deoxyribonucleoside 5'-monophosphate N-glycosidase [Chloroflexi bacterium]|jgi:2'-deoxynucleoside 5'-phosphate N-hydrolase|nr:deoxyribonucleoside 5'-monophosphate N-glycosidase [Chloroflexota bacterium]